MDNLDLKSLKKLAAACRKAGIKTYKGQGVEFTLGDLPEPQARSQKAKAASPDTITDTVNDQIETDSISGDALLFWSSQGPPGAETDESKDQ